MAVRLISKVFPVYMDIEKINPAGVHFNPAAAHAVLVTGVGRLLFLGGQNGVDIAGNVVVGLRAQTEQALKNLMSVLGAGGGMPENIVKMTVYLVAGADPEEAFAAASRVWGRRPTAMTVVLVSGLANPDFLIEIDAIAAMPG